MSTKDRLSGLRRKRRLPGPDGFDEPLLNTPKHDYDVVDVRTADGADLRVHAYGPADAPPIVFSHGWTCRIEYWNPQINALADNYRVIAYDQRGHGESGLGSRKFSVGMLADDLADVLAATVDPKSNAVLVGHSMGGMSVLAWAGRHPEQVRRYAGALLLANTAADRLVAESKLVPKPNGVPDMPLLAGKVILGAPVPLPITGITRMVFRSRVLAKTATDDQVDFAQRLIFGCPPRVRGQWGLVLTGVDLRAALDHIDVPTSVVAGEFDNLLPAVHAERLAEALDRRGVLDRLDVIENTGHLSSVEATDRFNAELERLSALATRQDQREPVRANVS